MFRLGSRSALLAGGAIYALVSILSAQAAAQTVSPPDFAGKGYTGWVTTGGPALRPPLRGPGPVVDDAAHPNISNGIFEVTGQQPTFPVADLSNPILLPWVREELRKRNERALSGKDAFGPHQSCWPVGIPALLQQAVQPIYFIQTPEKVTMIWQNDHQVRHIYLNVPHSVNPKPSWFGESVAWYEGDTLVVDTIGLNTRTFVDRFLTPHTDQLHVIERFRLIDNGMTMEIDIHVEDPGAFTTPWNAIKRLRRDESGPLLEAVCAENPTNYFNLDMQPLPVAAVPDF